MTDLNSMTKAELAVIIGGMTPSQIKKAAHADLVQRAGELSPATTDPVLDNSSTLTPTEDDVLAVLKSLTAPEQHLLVAFAH